MKKLLLFFALILFFGNKGYSQTKVVCANATTQMEMTLCAQQEFSAADKQLNVIYKKVITACNVKQRAALTRAQKAWLLYRDGHAAMEGLIYEGGSMEPMMISSSKTTITLLRIKELQGLLDQGL